MNSELNPCCCFQGQERRRVMYLHLIAYGMITTSQCEKTANKLAWMLRNTTKLEEKY